MVSNGAEQCRVVPGCNDYRSKVARVRWLRSKFIYFLNIFVFGASMMAFISNSMTDDDTSLPLDLNKTSVFPLMMEGASSTTMNETQAKYSDVHTLKEHEMKISDLRKENFELKLRIYFLEEKLQQSQRDDDEDDAFKMNIELKIEIEKLKNELNEKRKLLSKASTAVDSLDRNHQEQIKKLRDQHNRDLDAQKQNYEKKLQENEEAMKSANALSEQLREKLEELREKLMEAERTNRQIKEGSGATSIEATEVQAQLQARLREKERIIDELRSAVDIRESRVKPVTKADHPEIAQEIKGLTLKVADQDAQIQNLNEELKKSETSVKELRSLLQDSDRKFDLASHEAISTAQKLNEKLRLKQTELDEMQEKFRALQENLEKAQDIVDAASLKDVEAFEEKSKALMAKDALIAELQGNLKEKEMENDHLSRSLARKDMELKRIAESQESKQDDIDKVYEKEKELTTLSEELAETKSKLRTVSDEFDERLQKLKSDHENQLTCKDHVIQRITETLKDKESIIQDLIVTQENISLSSSLDDVTDTKEELVEKLRDRLKERDAAVEANIEEKFEALQKKEEEMQELRKNVRERDRLLENMNAIMMQHEDAVKSLQCSLDEKVALVCDLKTNQSTRENQFQEAHELAKKKQRENEGLIEKLKRNLANREQQVENLKNILHQNTSSEMTNSQDKQVISELSIVLREKENLVAELLAERSNMIDNHESSERTTLNTLAEKDRLLKDLYEKLDHTCTEKNGEIMKLQQKVNDLNLEIQAAENSKSWTKQEHEILHGKLKQSLVEKDRTIEKLIESGKEKDKLFIKLQDCTSNSPVSPVKQEVTNLKVKVGELENLLQEKQDIVAKLERDKEESESKNKEGQEKNKEYVSELESQLMEKDSLLKQAAETIEAFRVKLNKLPVLEELTESLEKSRNAYSESEIERKRLELEAQTVQKRHLDEIKGLQEEISSLKEKKSPGRKNLEGVKSDNQVHRLKELLQHQIQETSRLGDILKKEREAYEEVIKRVGGHSSVANIGEDIQQISELRRTLEDGIAQNNQLRLRLQKQFSENQFDRSLEDEVVKLRAKLADRERWNASLQSRLDALSPRVRGVGGSSSSLSESTASSQTSPSIYADEKDKEFTVLRSRLDESERCNSRVQKQLENARDSWREEKISLNKLNEKQKHEIDVLREQLMKSNDTCNDLRSRAKKADEEISSYKREHDVEFNTLKRALEDSKRINESLREQLNENRVNTSPQTFPLNRNDSRTLDCLQEELEKKSRTIEALNNKCDSLQKYLNERSLTIAPSASDKSGLDSEKFRLDNEKQSIVDRLEEDVDATLKSYRFTENIHWKTGKVEQLEAELLESRRVIKRLQERLLNNEEGESNLKNELGCRENLEARRTDVSSTNKFHENTIGLEALDEPDGSTPTVIGGAEQAQKQLRDMQLRVDELRQALSDSLSVSKKLKQDLNNSEQTVSLLEKDLANYAKKLREADSEVVHLKEEYSKMCTFNAAYLSQLNELRQQEESSTKLREDLAATKMSNEKLKDEVQRLLASIDTTGKENEKLREALLSTKRTKQHSKSTLTSPRLSNALHEQTGSPTSSREYQSLRERLNLSEKLNSALKFELEACKKNGASSKANEETFTAPLEELRVLRVRLEESIKTYDELCIQLENKLKELGEDGRDAISNEGSEAVVRENENLKRKIAKFNEQVKTIQRELEEHRLARKRDKEKITLLNSQLVESNKANESLRNELAICDSIIKAGQKSKPEGSSNNNDAIMLLLAEIRSLREQLETSIKSNNSLREMLQKQLTSSPQRQTQLPARSPEHSTLRNSPNVSPVMGQSSTTSFDSSSSPKEKQLNFEASKLQELRRYIDSGYENVESLLVKHMRMDLGNSDRNSELDEMKKDLENLRTLLFKSGRLLDHLWTAQVASGPTSADRLTRQNDELRKEISLLKKRVLSQSKILENTATRLESSSRMRKEVERSLFARLTETRETIGSSRKQLEDRLSSRNGN
ncbi:myomegalin-like isoform X2 [Xenia sp. Carnegie-2017]|uniref:myomegalin-like isoform X2 n=1 Tax=Xenia sp. Carnegie-2017 TaxID=2897299 RepID=UPI001F0437EB|nr:myomegalin-like isoform X2 [Xenia sp. Carnegie-2017]